MNEHLNSLGVCIPCHITSDQDLTFLYRALESIRYQTLKPREIVLSDDSPKNLNSLKILSAFPELNIRVIRNLFAQGIAGNSNFGVSQLKTEWVHVLHQDDWLSSSSGYEKIIEEIQDLGTNFRWILVSGTHEDGSVIVPLWKKSNLFGFNSIGGPSCLFTRNTDFIQYDERFRMLVDVKNYSDYFNSFGNPGVIKNPLINYGNPPTRVSRNMSPDQTLGELNLILKIKSVQLKDVIECLNDSTLNPYHRYVILKQANENFGISTNFYYRLFGSLLLSRLMFKLKNVFHI